MWTKMEMPDQSGKLAIVTGANSGIGYEIALALYEKGAHVILACRDEEKAQLAVEKMRQQDGAGKVEKGILNLANLQQIRKFANSITGKYAHLHLLINNAGVMGPPKSKTDDGFELQFGVNFLGHFALTGYLYSLLKDTPGSRVITVSSGTHSLVNEINFENLHSELSYDANREYAISKLAKVQFMIELQRRIDAAGHNTISAAAHPGVTQTDLSRHMTKEEYKAALERFKKLMPAWQGALPTLFAATSGEVKGGDYFGPDGERELHGYPAPAQLSNAARDESAARRLWEYAEATTGQDWP